MTKDQFIQKYRVVWTGLALYGTATEATYNPITKCNRALEIPKEVEMRLGMMYDDLNGEKKK